MTASSRRWAGPAIFALGFALYLVALPNDWVLDDRRFVFENPAVRDPASWRAIFARDYWWFQVPAALYRPVTVASMALQHAIAGDSPWSYRLVNALLHGFVAWLLYSLLVRRLEIAPRAAAIGAAVFAFHPALSEAVLQVVGRAEIFVALATLGILHLHLADYRLGRRGPATLMPAAVVLFAFALGAKESAVAIPPLVLAIDVARRRAGRRVLVHLFAFAALFAFWFGVRARVVAGIVELPPTIENPLHALTFAERIPGTLGVLGHYAKLTVVPIALSADYSQDAIPARPTVDDPAVIGGVLLTLAILGGFGWACARRRVGVTAGVALFALFLFPVSNVAVPIGTIFAERFLYVPILGVGILFALALERVPRLGPVALLAVALFGIRTGARERDWRNEETFYERMARGSRSAKAHWQHGLILHRSGQFAAAEAEYRRSLEIRPDYDLAIAHLARTLRSQNRLEDAKALYRRVIDAGIRDPNPYVDLGEILGDEGRYSEAIALFQRARGIDPKFPTAWFGEGKSFLAVTPPDLGRARECFEQALRLDPRLAPAWAGLGDCLRTSDRDEARKAYRRAMDLAPNESAYRKRLESLE